jgi:CspA family cold shock protein
MLSLFSKRVLALIAKPAVVAPIVALPRRAFSDDASAARESGKVKWFDATKGYGFIQRADGTDVFVHFSGIKGSGFRTLAEGQNVEFTIGTSVKGTAAVDVVGF